MKRDEALKKITYLKDMISRTTTKRGLYLISKLIQEIPDYFVGIHVFSKRNRSNQSDGLDKLYILRAHRFSSSFITVVKKINTDNEMSVSDFAKSIHSLAELSLQEVERLTIRHVKKDEKIAEKVN